MQTQATHRLSPFKEIIIKQLERIIEKTDNKFLELQKRIKGNLKDSRREKAVGGDHNADAIAPISPSSDPNMILAKGLAEKNIACRRAIERIRRSSNPWECQECGADLKIRDLRGRFWASRHKECQEEYEQNEKKKSELLRRESTYKRRH